MRTGSLSRWRPRGQVQCCLFEYFCFLITLSVIIISTRDISFIHLIVLLGPSTFLSHSGSLDCKCVVFNLASGRTLASLDEHDGAVNALSFHPIASMRKVGGKLLEGEVESLNITESIR